jgi:Leucine-rich repeat (LRR) protein
MGKTELSSLYFENNQVVDLSPLANLPDLQRLRLRDNAVTDISPLLQLAKLRSANLSGNPLNDESLEIIEQIRAETNTRITF